MRTPTSEQWWPPSERGSWRSRAINGYLSRVSHPLMTAAGLGGAVPPAALISAMRPGVNRSLVAMSPAPSGTTVESVRDVFYDGGRVRPGRVRGEWVGAHAGPARPATAERTIIYYLHGSGYVVCSARTHRGLVARLSRRTGWSAFSLDYRLGPEYVFPAAGDDAIRGYRWLLAAGFRAERIVVAGDSAGGHLAADLLADNHRTGTPQPAGVVMFSPLYDPTFELAVASQLRGVRDPIIDAVAAQRILRLYTGSAEPDHPRMRIALNTEMTLPPTLIQVGALEVMGDDARAMYREFRAAGADVRLQEWPDQGHVFQMFPRFSRESGRAVGLAADFMTGLPLPAAVRPRNAV
ncbi:alpha/beta hydrolase [Gordonia sp. SL306]|uniref:alpha/beta hydrolase n=1 Tax=Gordonia sp. SL306 TaxID=2995145 RepID=UPI0022715A3B|nr:alpha/beta hydrolase [Gordonia sp. SL306]WAC57747.1 alpha/beta hydrolase [Gordonia sp. SL306]